MLIGLDAIPLTEPRTGVGHYTLELARALARAAPADSFELAYPSRYPEINPEEVDGPSLPSNLSLERVRVGPLGRRWWAAGLPRYAARRGLALFHGTNFEVPLWGKTAKVVTVHDLSLLALPETHEPRRVRRARRRLPLMTRAADAVVTPTESVRREACELLGLPAAKVFAVPEAARECFRPAAFAETEEARRRLGTGAEFLLAVGTVEPRKNLPVLLEAFERVARAEASGELGAPDKAGGLRLVVAGRHGWLGEEFFARLAASPVRDRVVLTGYVSDADLRALYSACRVFVYPSRYEGFGLPPLEAMSCGAAVVAGRCGAVAEVTGGAARLFDPASTDELTRALLELLGDDGARDHLVEAGLRRAAEFSWDRAARMTLEVYGEALKRRSRR
jgi:glycosyltransferase involved in cell wall biosynthesis